MAWLYCMHGLSVRDIQQFIDLLHARLLVSVCTLRTSCSTIYFPAIAAPVEVINCLSACKLTDLLVSQQLKSTCCKAKAMSGQQMVRSARRDGCWRLRMQCQASHAMAQLCP